MDHRCGKSSGKSNIDGPAMLLGPQCHFGQVDLDLTDFWPPAVALNDMDGPSMLF
jgi:hypothetical protein